MTPALGKTTVQQIFRYYTDLHFSCSNYVILNTFQTFVHQTNYHKATIYTVDRKSRWFYSSNSISTYTVHNNELVPLDVIPAPKNVKITSISANFAMVQWSVIERQEEKYDRVTGHIVTVRNETHFFNIKVSNSSSYVSINQLLSNTTKRVSVVGLSEETEGMPSEWISFKTNLTQGKFER